MQHPDVPPVLRDDIARSTIALALGSAHDGNPLLMVNAGFSALTGYAAVQAVGRNCRFLQGAADNTAARAIIAEFLARGDLASVRTTLINHKADGTPFVNLLYMSKLRPAEGEVSLIFASQFDVSNAPMAWLRDYDRELGRTLDALTPVLSDRGLVMGGILTALADSAATIAQAKMILARLGPTGAERQRNEAWPEPGQDG